MKAGPKPDASNDSVPEKAIFAAFKLARQEKAVTISAVARLAGVSRTNLYRHTDVIKFIENLGAPDGRLRRGTKDGRTGAIEACDDPDD